MRMNKVLTVVTLALMLSILLAPMIVKSFVVAVSITGHGQVLKLVVKVVKKVVKKLPKPPIQPDPPSDWPIPSG